ncbi:hypothetical protein WOLCODRAFT_145164 [Wolfiporia cocos MD-104 SS10]|uniref:Uncharacterized protein n=1 Tax=Wolfiporia cocos (strain MD-104) TaxID=742152 RepID=A0A2H3K3P8_WOLCO|nr:hypothetical protein WOLCODRAFT_145164 [Wolfiporia cocos MD-104 SS10]
MTSSLAYNQSKVDAGTAFGFWDDAVELLPYFERVDYTSTIGLYGASLYGTVLPNNCSGSVYTTGASANVSCGLLPNVSIYSPASVGNHTIVYDWIQAKYYYYNSGSVLQFNFSVPTDNNYLVAGSLSLVPYNNISEYDGQAQGQQNFTQFPGRNVIFMLATNTSSSDMQAQNNFSSHSTVTINGCSLDWAWQEWSIDVQTSLPSPQNSMWESLPDTPLTSLQAWEPMQGYYWDWVTNEQTEYLQPETPFRQLPEQEGIDVAGVYNPSADAWYSMISATIYLGDIISLLKDSVSASSISQFEADLASLTAIMYWSVMYLPPKSAQDAPWNMTDLSFYVIPPQNFTIFAIGSSSIATRLKLNIIQVSIGLGASTTLFLLAIHLTRFDGNIAPVTSLGVLQLLWLNDRQPSLSGDLGSIDNPTIENLRSAVQRLRTYGRWILLLLRDLCCKFRSLNKIQVDKTGVEFHEDVGLQTIHVLASQNSGAVATMFSVCMSLRLMEVLT